VRVLQRLGNRFTHLLVDSQNRNAVFAALCERLGVRVFGLVLALAIDDNRHRPMALGEEEEFVDATTNLLRQLQELEGLGRLEEDDLMAFILLTFRHNVLGNVSDSRLRQEK
jgi:hypothetical protein